MNSTVRLLASRTPYKKDGKDMLLVSAPKSVPWAPSAQIPTKVDIAQLGFSARLGRNMPQATILDQNGDAIQFYKPALPQQPPQPTAAQLQAWAETPCVAGDTEDQNLSRRSIPLVLAIFGLSCTVDMSNVPVATPRVQRPVRSGNVPPPSVPAP